MQLWNRETDVFNFICNNLKMTEIKDVAIKVFSYKRSLIWKFFLKAGLCSKAEETYDGRYCVTHSNFGEIVAWRTFQSSVILHWGGLICQQYCRNFSQLDNLNWLSKCRSFFSAIDSRRPTVLNFCFRLLTHKWVSSCWPIYKCEVLKFAITWLSGSRQCETILPCPTLL